MELTVVLGLVVAVAIVLVRVQPQNSSYATSHIVASLQLYLCNPQVPYKTHLVCAGSKLHHFPPLLTCALVCQ